MRDLIVRKVCVIDYSGYTVLSFEDSMIGLSELRVRYNELKSKCEEEASGSKTKYESIRNLLELVSIINSAFYNNYFYDTIKMLSDNHELKKFVNEVREFNIRDFILNHNSDQLIEYIAYFDTKNCLYRFSDEYVFTDYGNIEDFNEYMFDMKKIEYETVDDSFYEIRDENESEIVIDDEDAEKIIEFLNDESSGDDTDKSKSNTEVQLYNYPLHPAFLHYLNNTIIETKNFENKVELSLYAEAFLEAIKDHPQLSKYENDLRTTKLLISGNKKASLNQKMISPDPNVAYICGKTLIKTIYNDSTELVSHIFDKFLKIKDYEFFKNFSTKFIEYNLECFDDCQNFMLDVFDILRESNMLIELKCLDHLLASDTSLNKKEFIIISELMKYQLNLTALTPAFKNKFKADIEKDKGEERRQK